MAKKITLEDIGQQVGELTESIAFIVQNMATKDDVRSIVSEVTDPQFAELNRRATSLEKGQKEILDTLEPLSRAHDTDSEKIIDHDRRIARLERQVSV